MTWLAMQSPAVIAEVAVAVIVGGWLVFNGLAVLVRHAVNDWLAARQPKCGPGLNAHVPHPAAAAQHAGLLALADASLEKVTCGCQFWDPEGDRPLWVPCARHMEEAIGDMSA
jgi:hypothetical protein